MAGDPEKDRARVAGSTPAPSRQSAIRLGKGRRMSLKEIVLDGVAYVRADQVSTEATEKQIVIGQRGWVFVGDVSEDGDDIVIGNAQNIRVWGTTKGLGELAAGPTSSTKYDPYGVVRLPKLSVVARINVTEGAWS